MSYLGKKGAIPKVSKVKRTRDKANKIEGVAAGKEGELQKNVDDLLNNIGVTFIRIPDTMNSIVFGNPRIPVHVKAMIAAFTKGKPDTTILLRDGRYITIELKTKVGKLSPAQKKFRDGVGEDNFYVCRNIEQVIEVLQKYGVIAR
jgi:hypothetical protein